MHAPNLDRATRTLFLGLFPQSSMTALLGSAGPTSSEVSSSPRVIVIMKRSFKGGGLT
jgi:hypothetical protein